jgi:GAF domain-containing protein
LVAGEPFYRFYAGAPLTYLDGIRLGALCVLDLHPRDFTLGDRAELAALADEVVAIIAEREFPPLSSLTAR